MSLINEDARLTLQPGALGILHALEDATNSPDWAISQLRYLADLIEVRDREHRRRLASLMGRRGKEE